MYVPYDFKKDLDISFTGQSHSNRLEIVARIIRSGLHVEVFGYGWKNRTRLPFHQMVRLFSRSKINLYLSNAPNLNTQQIKGRNFEIPGTRNFQPSSIAETLSEYYEEGKEIILFASLEELIDKAEYYLQHEEKRNKIADNGYKHTLTEHTWHHRYDKIFEHVKYKSTSA